MDTILFDKEKQILTIHKKPDKKTALSGSDLVLNIDDIESVFTSRAKFKIFWLLGYIFFFASIIMYVLSINVFPNILSDVMLASLCIAIAFFIIYNIIKSKYTNILLKNGETISLKLNKLQVKEIIRIAEIIISKNDTAISNVISTRKLTLAKRGNYFYLNGKCFVKKRLFSNASYINAHIKPNENIKVSVKKRFNIIPILVLIIGIALIILGKVVADNYINQVTNDTSAFIENEYGLLLLMFVAMGAATMSMMYYICGFVFIILAVCYCNFIFTCRVKITLSNKLVLACRCGITKFKNINALIENVFDIPSKLSLVQERKI